MEVPDLGEGTTGGTSADADADADAADADADADADTDATDAAGAGAPEVARGEEDDEGLCDTVERGEGEGAGGESGLNVSHADSGRWNGAPVYVLGSRRNMGVITTPSGGGGDAADAMSAPMDRPGCCDAAAAWWCGWGKCVGRLIDEHGVAAADEAPPAPPVGNDT